MLLHQAVLLLAWMVSDSPLVLFAGIRLKPEKIELLFYYLFLDAGISKDIVHDA